MDLLKWAYERGYSVAWGPLSLLDRVRTELADRHEREEFDEDFFQKSLSKFRYLSEPPGFEARTVGVVAIPRVAHLIRFATESGPVDVVVPPTYLYYAETARGVLAELNDQIPGEGPHFVPVHAPLKALAVRTGLARYGRNNITYVPGLGSYHQLIGFATDLAPVQADQQTVPEVQPESGEPSLSPRCEGCSACQRTCPTEAIPGDRVLLRGERCLTFLNEYEEAWPDWLPATVHSCLVGCLLCQKVCPQNAGLLRYERAEEFTPDETAAILGAGNADDEDLRNRITEKLLRIGLDGYHSVLERNLKAILELDERVPSH